MSVRAVERTESPTPVLLTHAALQRAAKDQDTDFLKRAYKDSLLAANPTVSPDEVLAFITDSSIASLTRGLLAELDLPPLPKSLASRVVSSTRLKNYEPHRDILLRFEPAGAVVLLSTKSFMRSFVPKLPSPDVFAAALASSGDDDLRYFLVWMMRVSDLRDHSEHFDACLDILYERTKALARISPAPMHLVKEMSHLTPWTKKDLLASLIDLSDPACVYAWITHTLGVSAFFYPDSFDGERVAALIDRVKNDTKRLAARARALIPDSSLAKSIETIQEEERDYLLLHLPGLAKDILDQRDTAPLAAATVERMISSATDPAFAHQLLSVHLSSSLEDILTTVKRAS